MASPIREPVGDASIDELIALILQGQTELYAEVVERYQQDVYGVVSALLYDRSRTEDLVQQVFVNAYFALPRFLPGSDFGPWIRSIARNAVREQLRKQSRYDRRLKAYAEMLQSQLSENPGALAREETYREALDRCVARLPQREAVAIRLRYSEGKSFDQIAAILGGSPGTIRNLLCRVRARLRQDVERETSEP